MEKLPVLGSRTDIEISNEIAKAMRKFGTTDNELRNADAQRPLEAYETLRHLGARSDLLGIVGSLGDTMDDLSVLENLRRWNTEKQAEDALPHPKDQYLRDRQAQTDKIASETTENERAARQAKTEKLRELRLAGEKTSPADKRLPGKRQPR
jgi:hypothetical protein